VNIHSRLAELASLGATIDGIDRPLFTAADYAARRRFADWAVSGGLSVEQDRAGNVFARLDGGSERLPILCGSHLDTVKSGGAYDGALGVIGGLEALERIATSGVDLRGPLEVVAWAGEEGSRFPLGCLGSSAFAQLTPYADIVRLAADDGETFGTALAGPSGLLDGVRVRDDFPPAAAYLELHVEQGPVLERAAIRLGVVTAIAGQRRLRVEISGSQGHAGTVPMIGRADALCAASELVLAVEATARDVGESVATVGWLEVKPNQTNVVPGHVALRVDARSVDDARVAEIERRIRVAAQRIEQARGTTFRIELIEARAAAPMDERLRAIVRRECERFVAEPLDIPSGAGHDAMCLAQIVPTAMLFVPSIGGRSHIATEKTAPEDLELGIEALAAALLAADREFPFEARR
jgi:hydantoinase/carbamoylase family amidase